MLRKIIKIDREKCDGCGLCVSACHEGAIGLTDGKAALLRDDYCDGLGDCLPVCPTGAIAFEERVAPPYNEAEVKMNIARAKAEAETLPCGCPGTNAKAIKREESPPEAEAETLPCGCPATNAKSIKREESPPEAPARAAASQLKQWPVQIKLVPVNAPYFENASLLVAADCAAYAYGNFHSDFMRNKITLIGCPKLDMGDYSEKLTAIIKANSIKSMTVARMEVPCCGGIENAVRAALENSGKTLPWRVVVIGTDGSVLED